MQQEEFNKWLDGAIERYHTSSQTFQEQDNFLSAYVDLIRKAQKAKTEDEYAALRDTPIETDVFDKGSDTNPKKQYGDKSIPIHLWPALASAYGALALYNGKLKYGMSNFNATPVEASIYIAGGLRHFLAWAEGEEFDPVDGVPNLGGALANIAILLEARAAGTLIDDRKLGSGYLKERDALKKIVASLQNLHEGKNPRHYTIADGEIT